MAVIKPTVPGPAAAASITDALALPEGLPSISLAQVNACGRRNKQAAQLRAVLDAKVAAGGSVSTHEMDGILRRCHGRDGKCEANHAVVLAYYAQNHGHMFRGECGHKLAHALGKVEWSSLMVELAAFMEQLRAQEAEEEHKRALEKERFEDDVLRPEQKHAELKKDNGTAEERAALRLRDAQKTADDKGRLQHAHLLDVDDDLTAGGKLELSGVEAGKLALLKKGFANS